MRCSSPDTVAGLMTHSMHLSMSCPIYRVGICALHLLLLYESLLPKKGFMLLQTFSNKGIIGDHFQLSDGFLFLFSSFLFYL